MRQRGRVINGWYASSDTHSAEYIVIVILGNADELTIIADSSHHASVIFLFFGRLDAKTATSKERPWEQKVVLKIQ